MLLVTIVLHPTDLSEPARHTFDLACQIARSYGARVVVLHVVSRKQHLAGAVIGDPLAGFHEIAPDVPVETRVETGDPASVILRVAKETKCDLIVMGTRGRTGPKLSDDVVDKVVQRASCAVLTMRYSRSDKGRTDP